MSENYAKDARDVEPINEYQETVEAKQQFAEELFSHAEKPTTLPDDFDFEEDDPEDFERVVDEDRAEQQAEKWFNFAYGYAEYGNGQARVNAAGPGADLNGQTVVFKIPGWFADDELGQWEEWWFGNFEVAKEADGEWTAMCLSNLEPMSDRNEDSYFRNPIDEEWIPISLVDFAYIVVPEQSEDHLIFERGLDSSDLKHERGVREDADIEFVYIDHSSGYGPKIVIESPYEAKDAIKGLDWDQFHPDWDGDNWTIDAEALWPAVEELTMQGWSVAVDERIEKQTTSDALEQGNAPYIPAEVANDA